MEAGDAAAAGRRPHRQDTFDLRNQIHVHTVDEQRGYIEEHSILEDSSDVEGDGGEMMMMEDHDHDQDIDMVGDDEIDDYNSDSSSSLSIPNESIDFDLVYSLTNFAATVEGQASVVKGDSLFLMDDTNSYWWLVRVLKTQEVGYIPAENIETPFERLARLNRHRNVDLANPTEAEKADDFQAPLAKRSLSRNQSRPRVQLAITPSTDSKDSSKRAVAFTPRESVYRYPPAVWNEEDEDADAEWDEDDIEVEERVLNDTTAEEVEAMTAAQAPSGSVAAQAHASTFAMSEEDEVAAVAGASLPMQSEDTQMSWEELEDPRRQQSQQARPQASREALAQQQEQDRERQLQSRLQQQQLKQAESEQSVRTQPLDPANSTETKKVVVTPSVARDELQGSADQNQQQHHEGPLLPSAILAQQQSLQEQDRRRAREEIEAAEDAARKRVASTKPVSITSSAGPAGNNNDIANGAVQQQQPKELVRTPSQETRSSISSSTSSGGGKLRKEPQRPSSSSERDRERETDDERDGGKKKRGMFGGLFSRKKEKDKGRDKASMENIAGAAGIGAQDRISEESGLSSLHSHSHSGQYATNSSQEIIRGGPSPSNVRQQQQRTESPVQRSLTPQQQGQSATNMTVSPLASQLRDQDQQLYQQYLKRSPSSPPERPSYGLQSAPAVMPYAFSSSSANSSGIGTAASPNNMGLNITPSRPGGRPGSLILTSSIGGIDGQGSGVPELSVIRVFAGRNLQSEATFKTVLLNSSTSASELVRQSMQRFRLAAGEDASDYYLTVKQIEGSTYKLSNEEKPLVVFDQFVEESLEMPKVKRSSMGSISSISSNLSAHPAIRKLPMNDFTDDSAVKFYLNRKSDDGEDSLNADDEDATIIADSSSQALGDGDSFGSVGRGRYLTVTTGGPGSSVSPERERFTSPSLRFAMQVVIFPEELPDNMVFDPHTEAIVFKDTLRLRSQSSSAVNPGISQNQRKKFFLSPKNITVAEVIELGLERFGILEGVVDGGDEVEDKLTKRRSSTRVRYILTVQLDGQERELTPSSKVLDAFPKPPAFRRSTEMKRRSIDSAQLLGNIEDVQSDDPVFVLRRAVAYRSSAASRHRLSAPLDEIALSHLHRDSSASSSGASEALGIEMRDESKARQPSRQEIIAAQRAAARGNQKAMLSAEVNQLRGVDVMLPDRGMLRSQRLDIDNRMRYSYVQPDGETYDISELIEEELGGEEPRRATTPSGASGGGDLLNGAINGAKSGDGARLIDRLLNKISEKSVPASASGSSFRSTSPSMYSEDGGQTRASGVSNSRSATPTTSSVAAAGTRSATPTTGKESMYFSSRSRSVTPTAATALSGGLATAAHHHPQPSIESVMSDVSAYRTATTTTPVSSSQPSSQTKQQQTKIPKGEFGLTEMLAIIESKVSLNREPPPPDLDEVDRLLFGPKLDLESVHPQIREVYSGTLKKMAEIENDLGELLRKSMHLF